MGGANHLEVGAADLTPLTLKGATSQTANMLSIVDSSDGSLFMVDEAGRVGIGTDPSSESWIRIDTAPAASGNMVYANIIDTLTIGAKTSDIRSFEVN